MTSPIYLAMINDKEEAFYLLIEHITYPNDMCTECIMNTLLSNNHSTHLKYIEALLPYMSYENTSTISSILTNMIHHEWISEGVIHKVLDHGIGIHNDHLIEAVMWHRSPNLIDTIAERDGINVNAFSPRYRTRALHVAAYNGHIGVIRVLKDNGAHICSHDGMNRTPVQIYNKKHKGSKNFITGRKLLSF